MTIMAMVVGRTSSAHASLMHAARLVSSTLSSSSSAPLGTGSAPRGSPAARRGDERRRGLRRAASTDAQAPPPPPPPAQSAGPEFGSPEEIRATSAHIFRNFINLDADGKRTNARTGRKILRRALAGPKLMEYYPADPFSRDPFFEEPLEERCARRRSPLGPRVPRRAPRRVPRRLTARIAPARARTWTAASRRNAKLEKLRRRGKGAPKKGEGKRASKKR